MTTIRTIRTVAVLSVLAAGALTGRARAHEFVCEKAAGLVATDAQGSPILDEAGNVTFLAEPGPVLHVNTFPATIGFRVTLTNPLATDTSVVTAVADPLLALAPGTFGASIGPGFSLAAGASASEVLTVRVTSQSQCEELFGDALQACGGNAFQNAFTVEHEAGLAQCSARVVCEPPAAAPAACVYANAEDVPNTVAAFRADDTGSLTPVPGSPFPTGGDGTGGGLDASNRIVAQMGTHLYASNSGSGTISAFDIDPSTCALSRVQGSPFPAAPDFLGISLAASPEGRFLYAGANTQVRAFAVAPDGALSLVSTLDLHAAPDGMKVSPDGRFLAIALQPNQGVGMYVIAADGSLTPVPGSPFAVDARGGPGSVDFNCASNLLFVGESGVLALVDVFAVAGDGTLTPSGGTPFILFPGVNSNVAVLSPDDALLFVSNQDSNTITVASVGGGGSLAPVPGSPFPAPGAPLGMATDATGRFLYAGSLASLVHGFRVGPDGALTPVAGSPYPMSGFPMSVAVFPPKTCP